MVSSQWEQYVAAKLLINFKHLKGVSTFLLILDKKQLTYKISNERRMAIASVVGLDNQSLSLRIIISCLITKLTSNTSPISHHLPYIQINVLIGRAE